MIGLFYALGREPGSGECPGEGAGAWGPSPHMRASGFGGLGTESVGAAGASCGSRPLRAEVHARLHVGGLVFILRPDVMRPSVPQVPQIRAVPAQSESGP